MRFCKEHGGVHGALVPLVSIQDTTFCMVHSPQLRSIGTRLLRVGSTSNIRAPQLRRVVNP